MNLSCILSYTAIILLLLYLCMMYMCIYACTIFVQENCHLSPVIYEYLSDEAQNDSTILSGWTIIPITHIHKSISQTGRDSKKTHYRTSSPPPKYAFLRPDPRGRTFLQ